MRRWFGSASPQQRLMQHLFRTLGGAPDAVCLAYAEAEREGKVPRPCGAEFMTPGTHAHLLLQEGELRGWLRR